ncbi:MAG: hypothetical protein ACYTDY_09340 [Planctomycetota bacterium]|jgi:hypothetical protein
MDCHDAKERIFEGRRTAAVRRHLSKCGDCRDFAGDLETGGREIAEAFLAAGPRPGFEAQVAARLSEEELAATPGPASLTVRLIGLVLFLGLVLSGYLVVRGARRESPRPVERASGVVTAPHLDHPLVLAAARDRSDGPTLVSLGFAGETWSVPLSGDVEREVLHAWSRGARTVVVEVTEQVPFPEVTRILGVLERAGFAYDLKRPKS